MSKLENDLATLINLHGLPEPVREYRFAPPRRFRFDFAWLADPLKYPIPRAVLALPFNGVAVECEGGSWIQGAHTRGKHFESDCRKYNLATKLGWRVYRFTGEMIRSGEAIRVLKEEFEP